MARNESKFTGLCPGEVEELNEHKSAAYYKKNQSLFVEGSMPRGVFCLNEGRVKVYVRGDEGKEQIIHISKPGEIIGFRAMFSEEPYRVTAEAIEESNICFIAKEDFLSLMDSNASLRNGIIKEMSIELSDRAVFITNMAQKSVRERLAFVLVLLDDIYNGEQINLTREDLANYVGTATETLIRLLKEFKDEKFIDIHTRKIEILLKKELVKVAGIH
ncbi:MAG: Crp/Fnr family transcriptional regulator [Bacteroidota bacterium]